MVVMLFGVSCVGKTTTAKEMAKLLDVNYYDVDENMRLNFNVTNQGFIDKYPDRNLRDNIRYKFMELVTEKDKNCIVAVPPLSSNIFYEKFLNDENCLLIHLVDSVENLFKRTIYTDYYDNVYANNELYKMLHKIK